MKAGTGSIWRPVAISTVIALISIAAVCAVSKPFADCQSQIEKYEAAQHEYDYKYAVLAWVRCAGISVNANNGAITALATIVMAVFSLLLYRVTEVSIKIGSDALAESREANRVSSMAAGAAVDSANAAIAAERAWMLLDGKIATIAAVRGETGAPEWIDDGIWIGAKFTLTNFGKTPAKIQQVESEIRFFEDGKPEAMRNDSRVRWNWRQVVPPGQPIKHSGRYPLEAGICLTEEQWESLVDFSTDTPSSVFLQIAVRYEDIFGWLIEDTMSFELNVIDETSFLPDQDSDLTRTVFTPPRRPA